MKSPALTKRGQVLAFWIFVTSLVGLFCTLGSVITRLGRELDLCKTWHEQLDAGLQVVPDAGPLWVDVPDGSTPELACRNFCLPNYGFVLSSMTSTGHPISYFCDCRDDKARSAWPLNGKGHLK